ncbi:phosphoadenylyl-sulfate reductase [Alkalilimnicola ehrlichii MLHE-1]|uniref:Phosphoadenosine 5'-phosphosulfate reductase n=1 Tax=Alkalilimnicola ehrlichii (strain ATCC BAA-1101 / DSM 17681 / MLHE-1) TaxID=187272 RepID=CYSH_ALKEH|nr:phosphoadenylyl-sulfate reductase [Alkalilimnicola ehrlichii]Q0A6T1.1 RecName: Full=Phosphoadenosine 5'-phosphosulfate reductase; Short=PAPS reductase; AltName: Full=3'-phosphoadenylylsulfate reductase; AltName: Full=PAPS reductase, thioredoxin dependent; AltName: Full=PAPS sulfotransferase; AltName: Full=PAdoPS reductase [Alkalilimnicola ehrlichii MLHE-1]ABI57456.1 phosphoadenylylsulfate reductase (thioredoxin) [Alkalilimnicola ehrlichii MLHE-1]
MANRPQALKIHPQPVLAPGELDSVRRQLAAASAQERVRWGLARFPGRIVLASSFGAQAAVSLHLVTREQPDIPVVLVDTGYLFPETYRFVDELTERLGLNLQVARPAHSAAWQEARFGRLWEQGVEGIERYNRMNKVEPMQQALETLGADAWFAGLRRQQAHSRQQRQVVEIQNDRVKVHPIIDWTDRDVHRYLTRHDLPYHPLWHEGYVSIGDVHTTRRLADGMSEEETRFFGLRRECGLHDLV